MLSLILYIGKVILFTYICFLLLTFVNIYYHSKIRGGSKMGHPMLDINIYNSKLIYQIDTLGQNRNHIDIKVTRLNLGSKELTIMKT